jgi:phage terminase large subunit-like protein
VEIVNRAIGRDPFKTLKHEPPVNLRAVGVDIKQGIEKIMKPEIARWLPPSALINGSWEESYSKELRTLTLENGSTIEFMGYEQDLEKFAGTSRHGVWYDEEPPEEIFDECNQRLIDVAGDWWMTMTPIEGMTWTYDRIYIAARTNDDFHVTEVETDENPHINPGEIDVLQAGMSSDDKEARRRGKYIQIGGLIWKMLDERHFIDFFVPPREWLHFAMMDHGLSNPTCWLWAAVDKDGMMVVYDEYYQAGEVVSIHAAEVHKRSLLHNRVPDYNVGDPSIRSLDPITGTSVQLEYLEFGVPIVPGNNDVRAGISLVAQKLVGYGNPPRPFLYVCKDTCPNLVYEAQRYRWATWANKTMERSKNRKEEPHKKNDHSCDALRYGVASRPQVDDSTYRPEFYDPRGASRADSPYRGVVDSNLARELPGRNESVDAILGSEY